MFVAFAFDFIASARVCVCVSVDWLICRAYFTPVIQSFCSSWHSIRADSLAAALLFCSCLIVIRFCEFYILFPWFLNCWSSGSFALSSIFISLPLAKSSFFGMLECVCVCPHRFFSIFLLPQLHSIRFLHSFPVEHSIGWYFFFVSYFLCRYYFLRSLCLSLSFQQKTCFGDPVLFLMRSAPSATSRHLCLLQSHTYINHTSNSLGGSFERAKKRTNERTNEQN